MKELKTLKQREEEIKKGCGTYIGEGRVCGKKEFHHKIWGKFKMVSGKLCLECQVRLDELQKAKQEAIKRAKQCVKNINEKHYTKFNEGRLWELQDFFNITEEDLKSKNDKRKIFD